MTSRIFVDTNVLVYSGDQRDPAKRDIARGRLLGLAHTQGVVSTQVLQEFYVVATRKGGQQPEHAKAAIRLFRDQYQVVVVRPEIIEQAIDCSMVNQLSYWDAVLFICAASAGCTEIWSEDLNAGQTISGVRVVNPFEGIAS